MKKLIFFLCVLCVSAARLWRATTFTNANAITVCKIVTHGMTNVLSPTMNLMCYIYATDGTAPTTQVGTGSAAVNAATISGDVTFTGLSCALSANTKYALVVVGSAYDASNYVNLDYEIYLGGSYFGSAYSE